MTATTQHAGVVSRDARPLRRASVLTPRLLLWGLVGIAAFAGISAWLRPAASHTDVPIPSTPPEVAAVAEQAVCRWASGLGNTEPDLPANTTSAAPRCWAVVIRPHTTGAWQVTVAVDVPPNVTGTPGSETWFAAIGVARAADGTAVAVAEPAVVPPLSQRAVHAGSGSWRSASLDDPVSRTVAGFASAMLTGVGDVARYAAPGVELSPITPVPFTAVIVARVFVHKFSARDVAVQASLTAATRSGVSVPIAYELLLVVRDGRWEITRVSPVTSSTASLVMPSATSTSVAPPPSTVVTGD